jgi:hypothetical protein
MLTPLDKFNAKIFSEQLHTQFKIHLENMEPMVVELVEVKDSDPSPKIELFILHFLGPSAPRLPQSIHRLEHGKLGTFEIFLTAIGAEPEGILYESVFHRIRKSAPANKE